MVSALERYKYVLLAIVLAVGAAASYLIASYAYGVNGQFGFPLDDPWIHLQFAKNLHEYGSFSYFKNEMITSGSTSPLYTILLAIGFFVTSNEMVLSYVLGVVSLLIAGYFMFRAATIQHTNVQNAWILGLGAALLLLLEVRMQWAALSGMETSLFICLLLAVGYFYQAKQAVSLGIAAGLLIWSRPEAVIFFIAIGLDAAYHTMWAVPPKTKKKSETPPSTSFIWMKPAILILAGFAIAYAAFNLALSGSLLPNTYAAKIKYYTNLNRETFAVEAFRFVAGGHMIVVSALAALGILNVLLKFWKRQTQNLLLPLLWAVGLFGAYYIKLPFLYQEGRYLMPLLPFVLLLGVGGVRFLVSPERKLFGLLRRKADVVFVYGAVLLAVAVQFGFGLSERKGDYANYCQYINDRQVRAGKWLHDNTPENAIIGTHDIGAIAYYSERRIADMVGLVSPGMIDRIGRLDLLRQFLVEQHVTHVATLRNWFEIVNQTPLFKTDERNPEIMEVFDFVPEKTHLTPQNASSATVAAERYLSTGQFGIAEQALTDALAADPRNSRVRHLSGVLLMMTGRLEEATSQFNLALQLHPDFLEAKIGLAQVAARGNRPDDAIAQLEAIVRQHPDYPTAYGALADVYSTFKIDQRKSDFYMQRFNELTSKRPQ